MGKGSKLRVTDEVREPKPEGRYSYPDGSRKLYDRNACPDGLDQDIWNLVLLFEAKAEENGFSIVGRPIAYTEMKHRIEASGIKRDHDDWLGVLQLMIVYFWYEENGSQFSVNNFCGVEKFQFYHELVTDEMARKKLLASGIRIRQSDRDSQPSKSTDDESLVRSIITRSYTEDELLRKMKDFRETE